MADIIVMTPEQQEEYATWKSKLPPHIQKVVEVCPPTKLYRNKPAGNQRVVIVSYQDDGTMTVLVTGKYNACSFERRVFGVNAEDLEECDLPGDDEKLGAALTTQQEIDEYIEKTRPFVLAERERRKNELEGK